MAKGFLTSGGSAQGGSHAPDVAVGASQGGDANAGAIGQLVKVVAIPSFSGIAHDGTGNGVAHGYAAEAQACASWC